MTDWTAAACIGHDPALWDAPMVTGRGKKTIPAHPERLTQAVAICQSCPIALDCVADAIEHADVGVIRGGLTDRERPKSGQPRPRWGEWAGSQDGPIRCGTVSGYHTHHRRGKSPCEACREAMAAYKRAYRAARARGDA